MPVSTADKRATFKKMHASGCFIIPNPFDVGSAKALQHLGFKALASTSAGFAWTIAKADNRVTVDDVCDHLTAICAAVVESGKQLGLSYQEDVNGIGHNSVNTIGWCQQTRNGRRRASASFSRASSRSRPSTSMPKWRCGL